MKKLTYSLILLAAILTLSITLKASSNPLGTTTLNFALWAISPYCYLGLLTKLVSSEAAKLTTFTITLLFAVFGSWIMLDALFINHDAQGGLVLVFIPGWQWTLLLLLSIPLYFLNKLKS